MPRSVRCPSCSATVTVPADHTEPTIRCDICWANLPLAAPAARAESAAKPAGPSVAKPIPARPAPAAAMPVAVPTSSSRTRRRVDDDDDDTPRRKKADDGGKTGLIVVLSIVGVFGLLLLAGGAFLIYLFASGGERPKAAATQITPKPIIVNTPPPVEMRWQTVIGGDGFDAKFPFVGALSVSRSSFTTGNLKSGKPHRYKRVSCQPVNGVDFTVVVVTALNGELPDATEVIEATYPELNARGGSRISQLGGGPASEYFVSSQTTGAGATGWGRTVGDRLYVVISREQTDSQGKRDLIAQAELKSRFLSEFRITYVPPVTTPPTVTPPVTNPPTTVNPPTPQPAWDAAWVPFPQGSWVKFDSPPMKVRQFDLWIKDQRHVGWEHSGTDGQSSLSFRVYVTDLPDEVTLPPDQLARELYGIKAVAAGPAPCTIDGHPGQEFIWKDPPNSLLTNAVRAVRVGCRLFVFDVREFSDHMLPAGTPTRDERRKKFYESIKITFDPKTPAPKPMVVGSIPKPMDDWKPVPEGVGLTAVMPHIGRSVPRTRSFEGKLARGEEFSGVDRGTFVRYTAGYIAVPPTTTLSTEDIVKSCHRIKPTGEPTDCKIGDLVAKEFVLTDSNKMPTKFVRFCRVGTRIYSFEVAESPSREDTGGPTREERRKKFFDSLKITYDPKTEAGPNPPK